MGRLHTPSEILDARGSFLKHPEERRPHEPKARRPLGPPPKWLSKEEQVVWRDLAKQLLPGVAFYSDRTHFELLVRLTNMMRTDFAHMKAADRKDFISLGARFAMTPADRAKVSVEAPKQSKLAQFLNAKPTGSRPPALLLPVLPLPATPAPGDPVN